MGNEGREYVVFDKAQIVPVFVIHVDWGRAILMFRGRLRTVNYTDQDVLNIDPDTMKDLMEMGMDWTKLSL